MFFHQPLWLLLLIPLPFLAALRVWSHVSSRRSGGNAMVSPRLRGELIVGASQGLRWSVFALNLLALACLTIALARPQWGFEESEMTSEGRNVIIAIDTSRSMLANDLQPDRMTRAKLTARDIVETLPEDRIGLIAFAGKAFLQAPLTVDHDAVMESIDQLDTEIIPRGGTNIEAPVQLALDTFTEAESSESALILFSDGEDLEGEEEIEDLRKQAASLGMIVIAIGVGTEKGSIIPAPDDLGRPQPGIFIKDDEGNVVRTRLNPAALQKLSVESGAGAYLNLNTSRSITAVVGKLIKSLSATRMEAQARQIPIERFMWPLCAALGLWIIAFLLPASTRSFMEKRASARNSKPPVPVPAAPLPNHRGSITAWIASGLLLLISGSAATADDESPAPSGFEALNNGNYQQAITAYEAELGVEESRKKRNWLEMGLGSAAYLEGDYEKAQAGFGEVLANAESDELVEKAHYNLGNTIFKKGVVAMEWDTIEPGQSESLPAADKATRETVRQQWESARDHFDESLTLNKQSAKALKNRHIVDIYLDILNQIEDEEKKKEEQEKNDENEDQQDDPEKQDDQEKEEPEEEDKPEDQEDKEEKKDPSEQEKSEQEPSKEEQSENQGDQGEPQDSNPKSGEEGEPQDNQSKGESSKEQEDSDGQPPQAPPEQAQPQPAEPKDGDLKANPGEPQPPQNMTQKEREVAAAMATNPETGYSPSQARKKLRDLSDENLDVKPIFEAVKGAKFRNW